MHFDAEIVIQQPKLLRIANVTPDDGGHLGFLNFEGDPLIFELGAASNRNQHPQKPLCTNFHAFFRK